MTRKVAALFLLSWAITVGASPIDVEDELMILWPDGMTQMNVDTPEPTQTELEIDFIPAPVQATATATAAPTGQAKDQPDLVQLSDGVDLNMTKIDSNTKLKDELEDVAGLGTSNGGNSTQAPAPPQSVPTDTAEKSSNLELDQGQANTEVESVSVNRIHPAGASTPKGSFDHDADDDGSDTGSDKSAGVAGTSDNISEFQIGLKTPKKPIPLPLPEKEASSPLSDKEAPSLPEKEASPLPEKEVSSLPDIKTSSGSGTGRNPYGGSSYGGSTFTKSGSAIADSGSELAESGSTLAGSGIRDTALGHSSFGVPASSLSSSSGPAGKSGFLSSFSKYGGSTGSSSGFGRSGSSSSSSLDSLREDKYSLEDSDK